MKTGISHLYIPGPTNVPDVVRQAMNVPMQDMRAHDFGAQWLSLFADLKDMMQTKDGTVMLFPGSGTAAWEAAMTNTLSPGDRVLMARHGQFSTLWVEMAERLGLDVEVVDCEWGTGAPVAEFARRLAADRKGAIKAVFATHNETATGVTSDIAAVRGAMDAAHHPALFFVDAVSSFGSLAFEMDAWGVDLAVAGSQKGLMCPAGLGVLGVSPKALEAHKGATLRRAYFEFKDMLAMNAGGYFPYTPPTQLLHGMRAAIDRIKAEGMENVVARHARLAEGVRRAVAAWGLQVVCEDPALYSDTVTAIRVPADVDAREVIRIAYDRYCTSLGSGLSRLAGKVFRIGHLGDLNEGMVLTALSVTEMALSEAGVNIRFGSGVAAAQTWFSTGRRVTDTPAIAAA
jgi:alanine-glyoxylate transaminase / serine-glyoxylate transaminase / serine-pyruvate transaminase